MNSIIEKLDPTISVDVNSLYINSDLSNNSNEITLSQNDEENVLFLLKDKRKIKGRPLDFRSVDFVGPAEAIKEIITIPYSNNNSTFALHRIGNSLLVESLTNFDDDENEFESEKNIKTSTNLSSLINTDALVTGLERISKISTEKRTFSDDLVDDSIGDSFLPPVSQYFKKQHHPAPFLQSMYWQLGELKFSVGSDLPIYSTLEHPAITFKAHDTASQLEFSTCLDYYLDNVMSNVPELALCLHSRGFVRGVSIINTEEIPNLNSFPYFELSQCQSFDPKMIEFNALTILRFLKENCKTDNRTYIVNRTGVHDSNTFSMPIDTIQVYDVSSISVLQQKKWKWMLAMVSYRFAIRLEHLLNNASSVARIQIRDRQLALFKSCYDLLLEIRLLGGEKHGTIVSAVLEHMADIHLERVFLHTQLKQSKSANLPSSSPENAHNFCSGRNAGQEIEQIDVNKELEDAFEFLELAANSLIELLTSDSGGLAEINTITVGDVKCAPILCGNEKINELDSENYEDESIDVTILLQFSGILKKLITSASQIMRDCIGKSRPTDAVKILGKLIAPTQHWIQVSVDIKSKINILSKSNQTFSEKYFDLWSVDQTILMVLPTLCDIISDLCRELYRQFTTNLADSENIWKDCSNSIIASVTWITLMIMLVNSSGLIDSQDWFSTFQDRVLPHDTALLTRYQDFVWNGLCGGRTMSNLCLQGLRSTFFNISPNIYWDQGENNPILQVLRVQAFFLLCKLLLYAHKQSKADINIWKDFVIQFSTNPRPKNQCSKSRKFELTLQWETDSLVRETLRKIADSCNNMGQIYSKLKFNEDQNPLKYNTEVVNANLSNVYNLFEGEFVVSAKLICNLYLTAIYFFNLTNDNINIANIYCNICTLNRVLSSYLILYLETTKSSSISSLICCYIKGDEISARGQKRKKQGVEQRNSFETTFPEEFIVTLRSPLQYIEVALNACKHGHFSLNQREAVNSIAWDNVSFEAANCFFELGMLHKRCCGCYNEARFQDIQSEASYSSHLHASIESFGQALKIYTELKRNRKIALCNFQIGLSYKSLIDTKRMEKIGFQESALNYYKASLEYFQKYDIGPTLLLILIDISDLYLFICIQDDTSSELLKMYLRETYRSLLSCRSVLTPIVLEKYHHAIFSISKHFVEQLSKFLKLLLVSLNSNLVKYENCIKQLKSLYYEILCDIMNCETYNTAKCIQITDILDKISKSNDLVEFLDITN